LRIAFGSIYTNPVAVQRGCLRNSLCFMNAL
jgi:hypothetical protein